MLPFTSLDIFNWSALDQTKPDHKCPRGLQNTHETQTNNRSFFEEYDSSRGKSSSFITIYMPDIKHHHWKIFSDISSPMFPIYSHIGIWFTHRNSPVSLCSSHNHLPKHAPPQDTLETWLTARPHPFGGDKKRKPLKKPMGEKHETHHPGHIVLFF